MKAFLYGTCLIFGLLTAMQGVAEPYGFAGCGAGTRIFGPRNMQTSASTTNHGGITPAPDVRWFFIPTSQPWSITFDLAGCDEDAEPYIYFEQYDYMFANFATLSKELAQGEGDTVDGLAASFGCTQDSYQDFARHVRGHYSDIFAQPGIRASFLELRERLSQNVALTTQCQHINLNTDSAPQLAKSAQGDNS